MTGRAPLRLVVSGADGMAGRTVAEAAAAAGHEVRAVVHPGRASALQRSARLHVVVGDPGEALTADGMVRGADAVVIVNVPDEGGLPQILDAVARAMHVHGVARLLVVSAVPLPEGFAAGDLDWTVIGVPDLTEGAAAGPVRVRPDAAPAPGARIPAADVADFVLTTLASGGWRRAKVALDCRS